MEQATPNPLNDLSFPRAAKIAGVTTQTIHN